MVHELKKAIEEKKVLFGIKEIMKNTKNLEKVFVAADCRNEIIGILENNKIIMEPLDFSKDELASKLTLDFKCEVFGLKK